VLNQVHSWWQVRRCRGNRIDLEGDDPVKDGGREPVPTRGAEHDLLAVEQIGDRVRSGQRRLGEDHPPDDSSGQQPQALLPVHLGELRRLRHEVPPTRGIR
jgi:hypothetical protein